tara:strand:- start:104 stop:364 length:261 start_codon:yes stop_codon:yes gene_type:complete
MTKFSFSRVIKMPASVVKQVTLRGDPNSVYAKTLSLKPGEGFVVYNKSTTDLSLPYQQAAKLGIKFIARSNFRMGEKKGTLIYRLK